MNIKDEFNPFLLAGYTEPEFFCNRNNEVNELIANANAKFNTTIFAKRRLGKTGLIKHFFYQFKDKRNVSHIYIDIYATQTLKDFTNILSNAIYQKFPAKGIGKQLIDAIKSFRPIIGFDNLTGAPELTLDVTENKQIEKAIPQVLQFLDSKNIKVVIAIDEFQQILNYPEKNVEALLRTTIQNLKNINFIFCGSHLAMMHEIFNSAKRPFYASCKNMHLNKIEEQDYFNFIKNHFTKRKRKIEDDAILFILNFTYRHTYYTQYIANKTFALNKKQVNLQDIQLVCKQALEDNAPTFFQYRNLLTASQWSLLKAIAKADTLEQPFSKTFIHTFKLGTGSIVKRSLEALVNKEMVYYNTTIATPHYAVYDKFLLRWLQMLP